MLIVIQEFCCKATVLEWHQEYQALTGCRFLDLKLKDRSHELLGYNKWSCDAWHVQGIHL